ncbi:hypothetical protein H8E07_15095 [bacterium]|nr:hypothetical protein [bacterium]
MPNDTRGGEKPNRRQAVERMRRELEKSGATPEYAKKKALHIAKLQERGGGVRRDR